MPRAFFNIKVTTKERKLLEFALTELAAKAPDGSDYVYSKKDCRDLLKIIKHSKVWIEASR